MPSSHTPFGQTTTELRRAYCQIAAKEISAASCRLSQGHEGCFGCASPFRLCEACRARTVVVAAVGMCSLCLRQAIAKELATEIAPYDETEKVDCQLLGRPIKVKMCNATQGQEGCKRCAAPSRLCEHCYQRPVRFPLYGMCLSCSVKEFGDGWNPDLLNADVETEQETAVPQESKILDISDVIPANQQARIREQGASTASNIQHRSTFTQRVMTIDEVQRFFESVDNARDRAIFRVLYRGSVRLSDLVSFKRSQVDLSEQRIIVVRKRSAPRYIELDAVCCEALSNYFASVRIREEWPLFGNGRTHISQRQIQRLFRMYVAKAGIDTTLTYRSLRRGIAARVVIRGNPIDIVTALSRHREILKTRHHKATPNTAVVYGDSLTARAKRLALQEHRVSVGLLVTSLPTTEKIARKILDYLEFEGVVGPANQAGEREVLIPRSDTERSVLLVNDARRLVTSTGRTSVAFLSQELKIGRGLANTLLNSLESEGIIGWESQHHRRIVLTATTESAPTHPSRKKVPTLLRRRTVSTELVQSLVAIVGDSSPIGQALMTLLRESEELKKLRRKIKRIAAGKT